MLEQVKYENHLGEVIAFGKEGIFVNENDLRDFAWKYTEKNSRISSFQKGIVQKSLPVVIACNTEEEGIAKRNELFGVFEKDVLAKKHGKIIIGDYYMKCFITESRKNGYLLSKKVLTLQLVVLTDYPTWIKESTNVFRRLDSEIIEENPGNSLDYPFDYLFDFASEMASRDVVNGNFMPTNFRMIIYGECTAPKIYIGDHCYSVNTEILANEYLVVDSAEKTIRLVRENGEQLNRFNDRSRDDYVFEKIPSGSSLVAWEGSFGFDIILYDERSEPKWT